MSGRPSNNLFAEMAAKKLRKTDVVVIPKEKNTMAVTNEQPQNTMAIEDDGRVYSQEEKDAAERAVEEALKYSARVNKIPETEKEGYFKILTGYTDDKGEKIKAKYKITIAEDDNLSCEENQLKVYYNGTRLFYKDGNKPLISRNINIIGDFGNKLIAGEIGPGDQKRILQFLYDEAFINGTQLKEMALGGSQAQTTVRAQPAGQITKINKDSSAENIAGNWNVGIFANNDAKITTQTFNNTNKFSSLPKLKSFIDNLTELELEGKGIKALNNSMNELKQVILNGDSEKYASIKDNIEKTKVEISKLFSKEIIQRMQAEVRESDASIADLLKKTFDPDNLTQTFEDLIQNFESPKLGGGLGFIANRIRNASLALSKIKQFEEFDSLYSSIGKEKLSQVRDKFLEVDSKKPSIARKAVVGIEPKQESKAENVPLQRPMPLSFLAEVQAAGNPAKKQGMEVIDPTKTTAPIVDKGVKKVVRLKR